MRVLIIDDSPDATFLVSALVDRLGHKTLSVNLPENTVAIATAWKPDFILLDIVMPGISGYEVARQLRSAGLESAKIIALSSHPADVQAQELTGIDGHVRKPISLQTLSELLGDIRNPL